MSSLGNFWIPSILMGLGIAIDVAIATISRFRDSSMSFSSWTFPVAIAHIVLPAIGYYSWWALGGVSNFLTLPLGLLAFFLISIFLYESFCEWVNLTPVLTLEPVSRFLLARLSFASRGRIVAVLAVSMDALWSGPAKAGQVASGNWDGGLVALSFLVAGLVVAGVSQVSLSVAGWLKSIKFEDLRSLAIYLVAGKYFEVSILFGFGLLSLWNAFAYWLGTGDIGFAIAVSGFALAGVWAFYWRSLFNSQLHEIEGALMSTEKVDGRDH